MTKIICDKCGRPMELRTAKRGNFAGKKFYGCTGYPKCKYVKDYYEVHQGVETAVGAQSDTLYNEFDRDSQLKHIVTWETTPICEDFVYQFMNCTASFSFIDVDEITQGDNKNELKNALSQWCLIEANIESVYFEHSDEKYKQILSVIRKILTRGYQTFVSPQFEKSFLENRRLPYRYSEDNGEITFEIESVKNKLEWIQNLRDACIRFIDEFQPRTIDCFNSKEEEIFYYDVFSALLGQRAMHFLHPQVKIANLLPGKQSYEFTGERVDFLFTIPTDIKVIIEIDGEQHKNPEQEEFDKRRDEALSAFGYNVIRIPVLEVRSKSGENLDRLKAVWEENVISTMNSSTLEFAAEDIIWSPIASSRLQMCLTYACERGILYPDAKSWSIKVIERDINIVDISIRDWIILVNNLSNLYGIKFLPEEFFVEIHNTVGKRTLCFKKNGEFKETSTSINDRLDLIIDISTKCSYLSKSNRISENQLSAIPTLEIRNVYVPCLLRYPVNQVNPALLDKENIREEILLYFLRYLFRKIAFWEGQVDVITRALTGKDSVVLLPTGGGKSLAYQLSSLLLPGFALVIDPIISLIDDQIDNLKRMGIDRVVGISSQIRRIDERELLIEYFGQGQFLFCFIAPERLQTKSFRDALQSLTALSPFSLIVIDEAHCVSEWGHDFRTSYLNIGRITRKYCQSRNVVPPLMALTGTASRAVLKDIQRELDILDFDAVITPKTFDRKELNFEILKVNSNEKSSKLRGYLRSLPSKFNIPEQIFFSSHGKKTCSGLVFCPHVEGDFGVVEQANTIKSSLGIDLAFYSGRAPRGYETNWNLIKKDAASNFKNNRFSLLVCTKAYGMGIDKPNIRYTIHFGIPPSIEAFYQEAGRAGRDKQKAICTILFSNDYPERADELLRPDIEVDKVGLTIESIEREDNDDVTRALFFHCRAFRGIDTELEMIKIVLSKLDDLGSEGTFRIVFPRGRNEDERDNERKKYEKAIHRLLLLGIVEDYLINYDEKIFEIKANRFSREKIVESILKYVESYDPALVDSIKNDLLKADSDDSEFIIRSARVLIEFIYKVIEKSRRMAIREVWQMAMHCNTNSQIKNRILLYLQETEYAKEIEKLLESKEVNLNEWNGLLKNVVSNKQAMELRGQIARYLEAYPDHPALLFLRGLSEALIRDDAGDDLKDFVRAGLNSLLKRYPKELELTFEVKKWLIDTISSKKLKYLDDISLVCFSQGSNIKLAKYCISKHKGDFLMLCSLREIIKSRLGEVNGLSHDLIGK